MWHFSHMSVLQYCCAVGSSVAKSVWQHPVACRQIHSCNYGVRKPIYNHISSYISSLGHVTFARRSASLWNLCSTCARQSRSLRYIRPQRCAFIKQLRHASTTKTFPTVVSGPVRQASKREIPKASDVYRLLSLAKPEKWKLLGECSLSVCCVIIFCIIL